MRAFALIACLAGLAAAAEPSGPDEKTRIKLAEYMLKTPLNEANPTVVSGFMQIDTETLPKNLREKSRAKQMEIDSFLKIKDGKKRGPFRYPAACVPKRHGPEGLKLMKMMMGNVEIDQDEVEYLEKRSECSEDQLICEFTLSVVVFPRKGQQPMRRYWMMEGDPLMAWIAEYREKGAGAGPANYFQTLKPTCQKSATP